ncbi:MAG: prolyl oligopeptidase family serine peptidase [Gammaproteobacteria bacterium]|nr:prolyl oligopeptidase family serine peptidase [Gammaproteobacteria bacterium]
MNGTGSMRATFGVALTLAAAPLAAAEDNRQAVFEQYLDFAAMVQGGSIEPNWLADGSSFWFADGGPANRVIWRVNPAADVVEPLFDVSRLRAAIGEAIGHEPPYAGVPFETFQLTSDGGTASFALEGGRLRLDMATYEVEAQPAPAATPAANVRPGTFPRRGYFSLPVPSPEVLSPDGKWYATLIEENVALRSVADGSIHPLTADGTFDDAWDVESARLTLGAGITIIYVPFTPWSPDSLKLWATLTDRSKLPRKGELHYMETLERIVPRPFAVAGGHLDHVRPHILHILSGERIVVDVDTEDCYFVLLGWVPDASEALFARFSRDFKTVDVMAARAGDGSVRTLFTETAETFVKIQHDVVSFGNAGFTALPDGSGFLWESTRDGWNHLYLYRNDGRLERQLTRGDYPVLEVQKIDQENGWVYFTAHGERPRVYDTHLYRVALGGGAAQRLTQDEGQHAVGFSPSLAYFLDTHSSPGRAPRVDLRAADGSLVRTLAEADTSTLESLGWTPTVEFSVKAADGETDLWGVMHRPYDFDPGKRYPVLEYLYAGPQIVATDRSFSLGLSKTQNLPRAMAQFGYVVVTLDGRGTPERSKAFQDVIYRSWGKNEIADHAGAIRQLGERHPFMDLDRVGIWGHSWGGYYAFAALAQAPDLYRAAVSSAPGYNPYASLLYEPYLDLPHRAKSAYEFASPYRLAPQVRGRLMLVGGLADFATFPEFMRMSRALIDAGIDHDQVVLPEEGHGYTGVAEDYYIRKLAGFFARNVMEAGR